MNFRLLQRYNVHQLVGNTLVKWVTATFAACCVCRRRGNAIPQSLVEDREHYMELLREIQGRRKDLPADTDRQAPVNNDTPAITNFTWQDYWRRTRIRRVPSTSTGPDSAPPNGQGKKYSAQDGANPF